MERLTRESWRNDDPWELCGLDNDCKRGCVNAGKWCEVAIKLRRLAKYEDSGFSPEEIEQLRDKPLPASLTNLIGGLTAENAELRRKNVILQHALKEAGHLLQQIADGPTSWPDYFLKQAEDTVGGLTDESAKNR